MLCAGRRRESHLCGDDGLSRFETAAQNLKGTLGLGARQKASTAVGAQEASLQKGLRTGRGQRALAVLEIP